MSFALITDDRGGASMSDLATVSLDDVVRPCVVCGKRFPIRLLRARSKRCLLCSSVQLRAKVVAAPVSSITTFGEDPGAQAFVDEHPDGTTLEVVSDALGLTRGRVRQIEEDALAKARAAAEREGLSPEDLAAALLNRGRSAEHMSPGASSAHDVPAASADVSTSRSWWRASSATATGRGKNEALPEELHSPLGCRLTSRLLEAELHAALLDELVRRAAAHDAGVDAGPIPTALERLVLELEGMPIAGDEVSTAGPDANAASGDRAGAPAAPRATSDRPPRDSRERPALTTAGVSPARAKERSMPAARMVEWNGKTLSIAEWAAELGLTPEGVRGRINKGLNPDGSSADASPPPRTKKPRAASPAPAAASTSAPLELLEKLGVAHELVATTPKGHVVLFPL